MYVSNLRAYIKAMGERLNIVAEFPEGAVTITDFSDVDAAANSGGSRILIRSRVSINLPPFAAQDCPPP